MPVDLSQAQAALSNIIHTNPASILRATRTNVNGVLTNVWTQVAQTACNPTYPQLEPRFAAVNDEVAGDPERAFLSFPYGTDIRVDDRVITLGRRYRVVRAFPTRQFALDTVAGVVDVTGEV